MWARPELGIRRRTEDPGRVAAGGIANVIPIRGKRLPLERNDFAHLWRRAIASPRLHQLAALVEQIATPIGGLNLVADRMGKRCLAYLV